MMRRHIKLLLVVTSLALVGAAVPPPVAAAPAGCSAPIETFDVSAEARRSSYRIGQTALVDIWVTDKFTGLPESDVHSAVVLEPTHKKRFVMDVGRTDDRGHVLLRLKLTDDGRVKPGKAKAIAAAWDLDRSPVYYCTDHRRGYSEYDNLFRIRR